jgi:hypothetical protein
VVVVARRGAGRVEMEGQSFLLQLGAFRRPHPGHTPPLSSFSSSPSLPPWPPSPFQELLEACLDFSYPTFDAYVDKVAALDRAVLRGGARMELTYRLHVLLTDLAIFRRRWVGGWVGVGGSAVIVPSHCLHLCLPPC